MVIFGIWIAALPYLGFPYFWKNTLLSLSGLILAYSGYLLYRENKQALEGNEDKKFENFSENKNFKENTAEPEMSENAN